ncbi:MAG: trypsin-like peptidase domain-containing protein [Planctomycetes bacterium]|nr:trypsin-like peptidase domain-containing protein [Planctomycetota bacterium]
MMRMACIPAFVTMLTFARMASGDEALPTTTQPASQLATQPVIPVPAPPQPVDPSPLLRGEKLLADVQAALVELVRRVDPAVVTIQADRNPAALGRRDDWTARPWVSTGAGVIIRDDGMILTSQHVIDRAGAISAVLHDGRVIRAIPIAEDRRADLAIIRIQSDNLQAAELAPDDSFRRGNIVVALGNPLGLSGDGQASVSHGIISAIGRPLPENFGRDEDRYYGDMIQTTAPINPGNSGGPLIDIYGRIIGVITAVSTRWDGHEGIGFAVPINAHTRSIINKLLHGQQVEYGYLGVEVEPIDDAKRRAAKLKDGEGVTVNTVFPGGPAERAGIRGGDAVSSVNGEVVRSVEHFVRAIGALGPNHVATIVYVRDAKQRTARVTLTRRPSNETKPMPDVQVSFRGAELGTVTQGTRLLANLPENALLVLRVETGSATDGAGLTPGDIIVRIDGEALSEKSLSARPPDARHPAGSGQRRFHSRKTQPPR